jgi:anti-sigma regulatory factor (Ser/Thr protein kinase)
MRFAVTGAGARSLALPDALTSPARSRSFIRAALQDWGQDESVDVALILVSELSSNVVVHAGTDMTVSVACDPDRHVVHIEVEDGSATIPAMQDRGRMSTSGRGLRLVDALATRWGVRPLAHGKAVWFELAASGC